MLDSRIFSLIKSPTRKQWQLRPLWSRSNNVGSLQWKKKKKIECLLRKYHRDAWHIFWSKKRRRCWEKRASIAETSGRKRNEDSNLAAEKSYAAFKGFGPCIKRAGRVLEPPAAAARRSLAPDWDQLFLVHPASAGAGVKCWSVSCSDDHLPAKVSPRHRQMVTVHFLLCVGPSESGTAT